MQSESDQAHVDKLIAGQDFLRNKKKSRIQTVWFNVEGLLYYNREKNKWYYIDETAEFCGPYYSMNDAAAGLEIYSARLLG